MIQFSINAYNNMLCVVNVNQTKKQNRKYQPKKKTKHTTNHQKWHKNVNVRSFFLKKMHIEMFNL